MLKSLKEVERPDTAVIREASRFSSATLHEAFGKKGNLPSEIKPVSTNMTICGPAVTVDSPPIDNIMLHEAIAIAQPGDVLVVSVSGVYEAGYWGDIMTLAAMEKGIQGLVINGCVRDSKDIIESGFPVFSRGLCIGGTAKNGGGTVNEPIVIGNILVEAGDLIVGDRDGIVVISKSEIDTVLKKAQNREDEEEKIRYELSKGKTTMEIYGWKSSFG